MGTVSGLRTRRYHGLLVVATAPPGGRMLGLAALDPVVVVGDARIRLAVHEWVGGAVDPDGNLRLSSFELRDGLPRWRYDLGAIVVERALAAGHGRSSVAVVHRLLRAAGPVRLELSALCTWRDTHGERFGDGVPAIERVDGGFVFEGAYRVSGPGFEPAGEWYRGVRYREEAARGLNDREDLWHAGTFAAELEPGGELPVLAWGGDLDDEPAPASDVLDEARSRARVLVQLAGAADEAEAALARAADRFVVAGP